MTPRRAGWVTGAVVLATLAALDIATAIARNATDAAAAADGGAIVISLALRLIPIAAAAGLLVAGIVASQRGRRAASVAATAAYVTVGLWVWWGSMNSPRAPEEDPLKYALELIAVFATTGTVFAMTAAVLAWWVARHTVGRDSAERVLALETTGLHGPRENWGEAMRAELASIEDPTERGRFAHSAGVFALRRGTGMWPVILAVFAGAGSAVVVFAAARMSFDRPRDRGIIGEPLLGLVLLLLVVAVVVGTLMGRSFRAGLETAVLAWVAVSVGTLAVEIPQAIAWFHDDGILLLDGAGAAGAGVDALGAALQPLTHYAFIFTAVAQFVVAVLAAAFAAMLVPVVHRLGVSRENHPQPT